MPSGINRPALTEDCKVVTTPKEIPNTKTVSPHNFGLFDAKGREHGLCVEVQKTEYVECNDPWVTCQVPVGTIGYKVCCTATKNGYDWGACQPYKYFETESTMLAYVEKRLKDSQKAAAKKK